LTPFANDELLVDHRPPIDDGFFLHQPHANLIVRNANRLALLSRLTGRRSMTISSRFKIHRHLIVLVSTRGTGSGSGLRLHHM
jgi:hypothetical protein